AGVGVAGYGGGGAGGVAVGGERFSRGARVAKVGMVGEVAGGVVGEGLGGLFARRGLAFEEQLVGLDKLREAGLGEVFQSGHAGMIVYRHHVVRVVGLQEAVAGAVLGDLLRQQPLGVEAVGAERFDDRADCRLAGLRGVVLLLGHRGEAEERALGAVPLAVLIVERGQLGMGGAGDDADVASHGRDAVVDGARRHHPVVLRQVRRVAGARVVEGNRR